jgi:hypothetical protein
VFRALALPTLRTVALLSTLGAGSLLAQSPNSAATDTKQDHEAHAVAWVVINHGASRTLEPSFDPQTVEAVKTFAERCPALKITLEKEKADFTVLVGHDPFRPWWRRDNKLAVFDRRGTAIFSISTRTLGNAVKAACEVMTKDSARQFTSSLLDPDRSRE